MNRELICADNIPAMVKVTRVFSKDAFKAGNAYFIRVHDNRIRSDVLKKMSIDSDHDTVDYVSSSLFYGVHALFETLSKDGKVAIFIIYMLDVILRVNIHIDMLMSADAAIAANTELPIEITEFCEDKPKPSSEEEVVGIVLPFKPT